MPDGVVRCTDCGKEFDPRESLMGDEGQCQLRWEAECDRSWWETCAGLLPRGAAAGGK
jgi:hypothetical protein